MPYRFWMLLLVSLVVLVACGDEDPPLPTRVVLPITETVTASPEATIDTKATWTPSPTPILSATPTEDISPTPSATVQSATPIVTLSFIQQTEVAIIQRRTAAADTATALVPDTETPTPTITYTPSITPTASYTPYVNPAVPDNPAPNHIIFTSDRAGSRDIWLMALDGSNPRPLVLDPNADDYTASCSPLGNQFVFDADFGNGREIYLGGFEGQVPRVLTDTDGENYHPVWSPLGDAIAFISTRGGQTALYIMDNGGGNVQRITDIEGDYQAPQWSPDGKQVLYAADVGEGFDLYAYTLETADTTRLTTTPDLNEDYPALAIDLETLAYTANLVAEEADTAALWLLTPDDNPVAAVTAQGAVSHPTWIEFGKVLVAADLGGVTHILLADLIDTRQNILTNTGLVNDYPRPCYIDSSLETAILPTGIPPTPTPSATPELIPQFTAVVNPGADWQTVEADFSIDDLEALAPDDYRLGNADAAIVNEFLLYAWVDGDGNTHRATIVLEAIDGALESSIINYTINNEAADFQNVFDLPFVVREALLAQSIPIGRYRLEALEFSEDAISLTLSIPPG